MTKKRKVATKRPSRGRGIRVMGQRPPPFYGGAWYDDVWSGIKSVAAPVNDFLKSTKAISTIGSLMPNSGVQTGAKIAGALGYGRRRGRMHGRGITPDDVILA